MRTDPLEAFVYLVAVGGVLCIVLLVVGFVMSAFMGPEPTMDDFVRDARDDESGRAA